MASRSLGGSRRPPHCVSEVLACSALTSVSRIGPGPIPSVHREAPTLSLSRVGAFAFCGSFASHYS